MKAFVCLVSVVLLGCDGSGAVQIPEPDQCLRREIFQQCMSSLPAGPVATKYNDWDEVVDSCASVALYQSKRNVAHIKPECRL